MADPRSFARDQSAEEYNPRATITPQGGSAGFVGAPPARNTGLEEGIKALQGIEPTLNHFIDERQAEDKTKDIAKARSDALANAMEYSAAVKAGKIAPTQSRWYMEAYKQQYGEVLADQWSAEAKQAWATNPLRNSDNPKAADDFINQFTKDKLASVGNDPHVLSGAVPRLAHANTALRAEQAAYTNKQVAEKNLENFGTLVAGDIDNFIKSGGKMSTGDLREAVKERVRLVSLQGVDYDTANKEVAQAFVAKARASGSLSLLKTLQEMDHIGNNPKYLQLIQSGADAITSRSASEAARAAANDQRAYIRDQRYAKSTVMGYLDDPKNRDSDFAPELKRMLIKSGELEWAQDYKRKLGTADKTQTPYEIHQIEQNVFNAGAHAAPAIQQMIATGLLRDPEVVSKMENLSRANDEHHLLTEKAYLDGQSEILALGQKDPLGNSLIDAKSAQDAAHGFSKEWLAWRTGPAGQAASAGAINAKQKELLEMYTDMATSATGLSGKSNGAKYERGGIYQFHPETQRAARAEQARRAAAAAKNNLLQNP